MASTASSPPSVQLLPRLDHGLPAKLRRGRKVWPGIFSFSAAYGSLKGCHELLLPSLLSAASTNSGESGGRVGRILCFAPHLCEPETLALDWSSVTIGEARSDDELLASVRLRVRSFYEFNQSYNIEGHKEYVVEREFEALKERVAGKKVGFRRASCINATLPLSKFSSRADDLCTACKFYDNEEQRVVIATLDLNQCLSLADELTGTRPEGTGNDLPRAYLSNVCVAQELQRNGLGNALVLRSRKVAEEWGITDLYVHVAVDNEAAKKLYEKTGFTYESEEPAWQARFLGRPRRFLLWSDLTRAK
ncbi:unnamed protein product [Spirodela intermedia]|uniref:N-acetyltransferase domain-containing protein n=1 Tax=Spirodela intermedia TaxID=51605 RepID=A0A7I8KNN2_SPIIN|nr:unnamed protein product [Spirodela intermedia]